MPFIVIRTRMLKISKEKEIALKTRLGKAIEILGKAKAGL